MSISATIYLPESAKIRDIADVIGISCGLKISTALLPGEGVFLEGLRFSSFIDIEPSIVFIDLHGELLDGQSWRRFVYNFEARGPRGYSRAVSISSTPIDLALGVRVINIFGGELVCRNDEEGRTLVPVPGSINSDLENVKRKLLPLTEAEIDAMTENAAYERVTRSPATPDQIQQDFDAHEEARIGMLTLRRKLNLGNIERERERSKSAGS